MTREQEMAALLIEDFKRGQVPTCLKGGIRGEGLEGKPGQHPQDDVRTALQSPFYEESFRDNEAWEHRYGQ